MGDLWIYHWLSVLIGVSASFQQRDSNVLKILVTTFPTGSDHGGNGEDGPPFHCLLLLLLLLLLLGFQQDGVVVDLQVEEHLVLKVDTLHSYITLSTDEDFESGK